MTWMRSDDSIHRRNVDKGDRFFRISAELHKRDDASLFKFIAVAVPKNSILVRIKIETAVLYLIRARLTEWHLSRANCGFRPLHRFAAGLRRHVYSLPICLCGVI